MLRYDTLCSVVLEKYMNTSAAVTAYIRQFPQSAQTLMRQLRTTIRAAAPQAKEMISYRIPFYEYRAPGYKGRMIYFGAFRTHVSVFVVPRSVPAALAKQMQPYMAGRSTMQFPLGKKIPLAMIRRLVKLRMKEIDASLALARKR